MKSKKTDDRKRNWTFVIYPESCAPDYRAKIDALHIAWAESPLHDQDIDADGKPKKPHIHIVITLEGKQSYEWIKSVCESVNGSIAPFPCDKNGNTPYVNSIRGIIRYLVHADNPEKTAYDKSDIIAHGGMDIEQYFGYPSEMVKRFLSEMMAFCDAKSIYEYSELMDYAVENKYDTWYDLLTIGRQSFVMIKYLDSKRNAARMRNEYKGD